MPNKARWALNPRKWFGALSHTAQKRTKKTNDANLVASPVIVQTIPPTTSISRPSTGKGSRSKILPSSSPVPLRKEISLVQYQFPAFSVRREPISPFLSSAKMGQRSALPNPPATQPSIRKNTASTERLIIDTTRWDTPITECDNGKFFQSPSLTSQYDNYPDSLFLYHHMDLNVSNLSNQCLIGYPQTSLNNLMEKDSPSTRSSSSLCDIDDAQDSSSSGIFTDERADLHDGQRTESKDTLSTVDVLSIESIGDSQTSFNHFSTRPINHHYRSPTSTDELPEKKSIVIRPQRARSAEGLLKDNRVQTPIPTRNRQSSAAIVKKIEKRLPTSRSPTVTLEKAGFVRVANDTYRLISNKNEHLYRRNRPTSIIQSLTNSDDSLRSAHDEESYANIPRASSTEHLHNDQPYDIRTIVNDCLRPKLMTTPPTPPLVTNKSKSNNRSNKAHLRGKRLHTNYEQVSNTIDEITEKLLSSVDCSIYAQYQRCYI